MAVEEAVTYKFSSDTKNLTKPIKDGTKEVGKFEKGLNKVQDTVKKYDKQIKIAAGAGVAFLTGSVLAAKSLNDAWQEIAIATGATGQDLEDLKGIARNVYGEMAVDATDLGKVIGVLNTFFGLTGEELELVTSDFINFAKVAGVDVASATESITLLMKNWNIEASETPAVLDTIAKVAQDTGISVESLTGLMQRNGGTLRTMGFNYKQSAALLGTFNKAGLPAEQMIAGLSRANRTWASSGKDARVEFKRVIDDIKSGNTKEAFSLFGRESATFVEAIKAGKFEFEDYAKAVEESSGTVADSFEAMFGEGTIGGAQEDIAALKQNVQLNLEQMGEAFTRVLAPAIKDVTDKVKEFTSWFTNLDKDTQKNIVTVLAVVTGILLLLSVLAKLIGIFQTIGTAITFLVSLVGLPWLLIIAGVIAVIAIIFVFRDEIWGFLVWLWSKIQEIWGKVMDFIVGAWNAITKSAGDAFNGIVSWFAGLPKKIGEIAQKVGQFFKDKFAEITKWAGDTVNGIVDFFIKLPGRITGAIGDVLNFLNPFKSTINTGSTAPILSGSEFGGSTQNVFNFNVTQSGQLTTSTLAHLRQRGKAVAGV